MGVDVHVVFGVKDLQVFEIDDGRFLRPDLQPANGKLDVLGRDAWVVAQMYA